MRCLFLWLGALFALGGVLHAAEPFDLTHARWTRILTAHVKNGEVDYAALKASPQELQSYLDSLAAVTRPEFDAWPEPDQIAFLLNLYNAATLKLVADNYPVKSIKDIGGLFGNPWKLKVVRLWDRLTTLDDVEHGILRAEYQEPRIHFALVCAARSCPPLRPEAYVGKRLDAQLQDQGRIFLADRAKNRVDPAGQTLWLSPIFKWFQEDFTANGKTVAEFVVPFLPAAEISGVSPKDFKVRYTDYDWSLNRR